MRFINEYHLDIYGNGKVTGSQISKRRKYQWQDFDWLLPPAGWDGAHFK